jgi:hypothetical protein
MDMGRPMNNGKGKTYYPIAKDRDQAFYTTRVYYPVWLNGHVLVPQLEGFKPKLKIINPFPILRHAILDRSFGINLQKQIETSC